MKLRPMADFIIWGRMIHADDSTRSERTTVAPFLLNASALEIDGEMNEKLKKHHNVKKFSFIHFIYLCSVVHFKV